MNFSGAFLYQLPYYFLIPIGTTLLLVYFSGRLAGWSGERPWRHLFLLHLYYLLLSIPAALLVGTLDDLATATMFLAALFFYGFLNVIPLWVIFRCRGKFRRRTDRAILLLGAAAALAISAYAQFVEPYDIEVTHRRIYWPGAPGMTIVQISDIQSEYLTSREKRAARIVADLKPDLVLVTGDYYSGDRRYQAAGFRAARYLLKRLRAKYGVFAVSGSSNIPDEHPVIFRDTGLRYLDNDNVVLDIRGKKIALVGLNYVHPDLPLAFRRLDPGLPIILLYHSPSIAFDSRGGPTAWRDALPHPFFHPSPNRDLIDYGADLVLVGHTHGGQVALPLFGPLLTGTRYGRKYSRGWFDFGAFRMYINRGLGMDGRFGPKIRFCSRPEIAVFRIVDPVLK